MAGHNMAWQAWQARLGAAGHGLVRHGRHGMAGQCMAGHNKAWQARHGPARPGKAWQGKAGKAWLGVARHGAAGQGKAWLAWPTIFSLLEGSIRASVGKHE